MPKPRKELVSLEDTPYYHCTSRCVRKAFLCGTDEQGQSYAHRRQWVEDKLLECASAFCIDIAAYAVMSNHYHVILHIDQDQALQLSTVEVITRWHQLFKGNFLSHRYLNDSDSLTDAEKRTLASLAEEWRERLMSISWFMKVVNESIAREANKEDQCTGHFWESRFHCDALPDEQALAACMAYVDLNPVRACMAKTPEASDHTSIKTRCTAASSATLPNSPDEQPATLMPFAGNPSHLSHTGLPFVLTDYLALVDLTGRRLRGDKRGFIEGDAQDILARLQIDAEGWLDLASNVEAHLKRQRLPDNTIAIQLSG